MKCLIYVTRGKPYIYGNPEIYGDIKLNGKIVAEFDGEVEDLFIRYSAFDFFMHTKTMTKEQLFKDSCLSQEDFEEYMPNYAIHIKNLVMDGWRDLEEFFTLGRDKVFRFAKRPPQNMMKVWAPAYPNYRDSYPSEDEYVLISIRPEWACKILNGEKTIEVRKQVLNCMKGE